ncbi:hypothetical protein [Rubellicoccus peritrichatus]|uniref:Verru_Chthon cassette protein A n=1 Tax=Rubellicoccus peritrichatus TaxID=3080537 RepID=A0AAQ3LBL6_9BACT|nr:hypothetical protein [Puniceicoccus sp. CR14]WOO41544.1 hypothetical protein RZN69_00485 [Puniceicoccus sp. CR14]
MRKHHSHSPKGFALITAIALMGFILLLLFSLTTLSQITLATTTIAKQQAMAEQNALLGLQTAIGQLQRFSGHDQRVTVRADLFDQQVDIQHPYWTGVYSSNSPAANWNSTMTMAEKFNEATAWLISGNDGLAPGDANFLTPDQAIQAGQSATLVSASTSDDAVEAPKQNVVKDDVTIGNYAYWIGDEGIKAKFNLQNPYANASSTTAEKMRAFQTAQRIGIEAMDAITSYPVNGSNLPLVRSFSETEFVMSDDLGDRFHDITFWSKSVLSNVKNGGLKHDLTAAFESPSVYNSIFANNADKELLNETGLVDVNAGSTGGPNWDILRSYYNLKDQVNNGSIDPIIPDSSPDAVVGSPYNVSNSFITSNHHRNNPVFPVVSRLQIGFAIESYPETLTDSMGQPTGETANKLRLHIKPVIALYNPYNVKINAATYFMQWDLFPRFKITPNWPKHSDAEPWVVGFRLHEILPIVNGALRRFKMTAANIDFEPGETRVFTLSGPNDLSLLGDWAELTPEAWTPDGSYWVNIDDVKTATVSNYAGNFDINNDRFGLTDVEKSRLTTTSDADSFEVEVTFFHTGDFELKIADGTTQTMLQNIREPWQDEDIDGMRPGTQSKSFVISELSTNPLDIGHWGYWLRTSKSDQPLRALVDTNIRALAVAEEWDGFNDQNGYALASFMEAPQSGNDPLTLAVLTDPEPQIVGDRNRGYWGGGVTVSSGNTHVPLIDLPRTPLISLGALQHAYLSSFGQDATYPLGNSFANPRIPRNQTMHEYTSVRYYKNDANSEVASIPVVDSSYYINEALWDNYFFSSVPTTLSDTEVKDTLSGKITTPLENPRIEFYQPGYYHREEKVLEAAHFTAPNTDEKYDALAGALMINGAFNINSTSVNAWKAILSSLSNQEVPKFDPAGADSDVQFTSEQEAFFSRMSRPYGGGFQSDDDLDIVENNKNFWRGYRRLNTAQINALAAEIVNQIKQRGPFLSMADFVNRKLTNDPLGLKGTLQAALDGADVEINSNLDTELDGGTIDEDALGNGFFPNFDGTQAAGFPGYLMQSDILQALSPVMTVRSDTFLIRSYGDVVDPISSKVISKVWCEAIVQRIPDPAISDSTLSNERNLFTGGSLFPEDVIDGAATNTFGSRRFELVAFRWMNETEL